MCKPSMPFMKKAELQEYLLLKILGAGQDTQHVLGGGGCWAVWVGPEDSHPPPPRCSANHWFGRS